MKYRIIAAALAALATPAAAGDLPRFAQAMGGVPPYEVLTIVRSAGLDPIGQVFRRGPTYVLRAIDDDDREVRVVVDARDGDIVSITPVITASRERPAREVPRRRYWGPYERTPYGHDLPTHRSGPPIVYESGPPLERPRAGMPDDPRYGGRQAVPPARGAEPPPVVYGERPSGRDAEPPPIIYGDRPARSAAPPIVAATPPDGIDRRQLSPPRSISPVGPQANIDTDVERAPGSDGMLPPPPDRFPQRVAPPAAKPAPPPKRAAAAPPKQAPLPKPRPAADTAKVDAAPAAPEPAPPPAKKSAADQVPH